MRRLAVGALVGVAALVVLWAYALFVLPDAPGSPARLRTMARTTPAVRVDQPEGMTASMAAGAGILLQVPVAGVARAAIRDSWGDPRDNGLRLHHGTDIMAAADTPVLAAAPGTVEKLWTSAAGGTTLYVRAPARDWVFYYAHLAGYAPGLHEGQVVAAGDTLGYVGDTGNAGAGNFHLHFGLARTTPEQRWYQGQDVDPYPYLAGTRLRP